MIYYNLYLYSNPFNLVFFYFAFPYLTVFYFIITYFNENICI